ncbi:TIGR03749 family integrating conjugative element protein [Endothiovibrio diazotrophicus]
MRAWFLLLLLGVFPLAVSAAEQEHALPAPERVLWEHVPIRLHLQVGAERIIEFSSPVRVGLPPKLQAGALSPLVVGPRVYLTAKSAFEVQRLMVKDAEGVTYLLDLSADEQPASSARLIVMNPPEEKVSGETSASPAQAMPEPLGAVALTRFAMQQLYAPKRLRTTPPGVSRVPVEHTPVNLLRGGAFRTTPVAAWRTTGAYVTAIEVVNLTDEARDVDPRAIRGPCGERGCFRHATLRYDRSRLGPHGGRWDTTVLVLISDRPLARVSHQLPTAPADPPAMTGRAPSGLLNIASTMPSSPSGPRTPSWRGLGVLATEVGEKRGLHESVY